MKLRFEDVEREHKSGSNSYEFYKRELVPKENAEQCVISLYEIPPGKSAYPYHYHTQNEESFYIIQGKGLLKTPDGCKEINAGDFLFFPATEKGAHKLTNISEDEMLIYLDFDTHNDIDVAFYPDSGKIGVWGKNINRLFKTAQQVGYYDGEE